jgi:phosphate transport system protein
MTTPRHLELELVELKRSLAGMGDLVEQALNLATDALLSPRSEVREQAKTIEERLDTLDQTVEDRIQKVIALQAPMAGDLRLLIAALRITADLEQMGDLAESVSKRAAYIARHQRVENPPEVERLCETVRTTVRQCLQSIGDTDRALVQGVVENEDRSDDLTKVCYEGIQARMANQPGLIREYTHLLRAVAHLEHIADLALAIAEESVYIHRGTLIRNSHDLLR